MSNGRQREAEAERALKELFAHAKPRLDPPAADTEEIRRAVYAEWDAVTGRRVRRTRAAYAAAASVLLAAAIWVINPTPEAPLAAVARVERVLGTVGADAPLVVGAALATGARVSTGTGQIALRLASGGSLRLAPGSDLVLTGVDQAELVAGALYFDSEQRRSGAEFVVTTDLGTVRDVGTQFFVQLDGDGSRLDVGVRDGRVVLMTSAESGTAGIGERLVTTQDAPAIRRQAMPTYGDAWGWAEELAPPFDTNGRSIRDLLAWFAAQTGRTIVFADAAAERLAEVRITGSIDVAGPEQKLSLVLATTDLTATLEGDGRVVISVR